VWWLLLTSLLVLVLFLGAYRLSNIVLYPDVKSAARTYEIETEQGKIIPEQFEALLREEVWLDSPYGYRLYGLYFPVVGAKKTVIIVHGITFSLYGAVKYMWLFYNRGYNVLMYDHRNHGRSGGNDTSYGFYEKYDLKAWVDWVLARTGSETVVGTHGESMGAAIALQHAVIDSRLAFVIADCPYASAKEQFIYRLGVEYHLPAFPLIPIASLITKLRKGWFFGDPAPITTIDQVQTPVYFIHGADDAYIPPEASVRLHAKKPTPKALWLAPHADHAEALWHNLEAYDRRIGEFLEMQSLAEV